MATNINPEYGQRDIAMYEEHNENQNLVTTLASDVSRIMEEINN